MSTLLKSKNSQNNQTFQYQLLGVLTVYLKQ